MASEEALSPRGLVHAADILCEIDPNISVQWVRFLLYVADHPGVSIVDVRAFLGMSVGAGSRAAERLVSVSDAGKEGLGLIDSRPAPHDGRVRQLHLTAAGRQLMARLRAAMEPSNRR